jgi:hypothetical protein
MQYILASEYIVGKYPIMFNRTKTSTTQEKPQKQKNADNDAATL